MHISFRRKKDRSPRSEKELGGRAARPILEERLAQLQNIDPGIQMKIEDMEDHRQLKGGYEVGEVDPLSFTDQVSADHGGGRYKVRFLQDGKGLTLRNGQQEYYVFSIEGESKRRKKKGEDKKDEIDLVKLIAKFLDNEAVVKFLTGIFGLLMGRDGQVNQSNMINQILEGVSKIQDMSAKYDPLEQLKKLAEVQSAINSRPPVVQGGASTFWQGLLKPFADSFADRALPPAQQAPALAGPGAQAATPTEPHPAPASTPQAVGDRQAAEAILTWVRWLAASKYDADEAAAYGVDSVIALEQAGVVPPQMSGLLHQADPSLAVSFFPMLIPELNADPDYAERFKAAAIRRIREAQTQLAQEQEAEGDVLQADFSESAADVPGPEPTAEADDSEPADAPVDQG